MDPDKPVYKKDGWNTPAPSTQQETFALMWQTKELTNNNQEEV